MNFKSVPFVIPGGSVGCPINRESAATKTVVLSPSAMLNNALSNDPLKPVQCLIEIACLDWAAKIFSLRS